MRPDSLLIIVRVIADLVNFVWLCAKPSRNLAAENLFLRKQLALYKERQIKPRSTDPATRFTMAFLSQRFAWRDALVIVQPRTLIRWHRQCYRTFWRNKTQAGRPTIPQELQLLIRRMANENITWGEERIANELLLKLGIALSPRTVRKYMPKRSNHQGPRGDQRWSTFLKNHASAIVACDFCVVVTANFRVLYVFVLIEHGSRRLIHTNVTANPTADWARQQIREAIPSDHRYRFLLHDRDCIFSTAFDETISNLGIKPIKTPRQSPKANAICERVIGTLRRECLDYVIPLSERHLRRILKFWVAHYNRSRPHSAIGPDIPSRVTKPSAKVVQLRRNIRPTDRIVATSILGGLHHDYQIMVA